MNDEQRLERAKAGLDVFFRNVEPQDSVGLTIFSRKSSRWWRRRR